MIRSEWGGSEDVLFMSTGGWHSALLVGGKGARATYYLHSAYPGNEYAAEVGHGTRAECASRVRRFLELELEVAS